MLKTLTKGWNKNTLNSLDGSYLLENALKSDNAETVQIVLDLVQDIFSSENTVLALTRGRADVVELFGLGEDKRSIEIVKRKQKLSTKQQALATGCPSLWSLLTTMK